MLAGVARQITRTIVDAGSAFSVVGFWHMVLCHLLTSVISKMHNMLIMMS